MAIDPIRNPSGLLRRKITIIAPLWACAGRALERALRQFPSAKVTRRADGLFEIMDVEVVSMELYVVAKVEEKCNEIRQRSAWQAMRAELEHQRDLARAAFKNR